MLSFIDKLNDFKNKLWRKPEELALIKMIKTNNIETQEGLESIMKINKNILSLTSAEFKNHIKSKLKEGMQNTKIKNGLDNWLVSLEDRNFLATRERDNLVVEGYVRDNNSLFWDKPFLVPSIVKEHCLKEAEKIEILKETDTSDMAVPIVGIPSGSDRESRMRVFNPYKSSMDNNFIGSTQFKESVSNIDTKDLYIISENFDTKNKNIYLIVESKGVKHALYVPKKPLVDFVLENCFVQDYISQGEFIFESWIKNRPLGFHNVLLKEFIDNEITDLEVNELSVKSVKRDEEDENIIINFLSSNGQNKTLIINEEEFFDFCIDNDPIATKHTTRLSSGEGMLFNDATYFEDTEIEKVTKEFLINKKIV